MTYTGIFVDGPLIGRQMTSEKRVVEVVETGGGEEDRRVLYSLQHLVVAGLEINVWSTRPMHELAMDTGGSVRTILLHSNIVPCIERDRMRAGDPTPSVAGRRKPRPEPREPEPHVDCGFIMAWVGPCKATAVAGDGHCDRHANLLCVSCKKVATTDCGHTGQFVCGQPLCDDCHHEGPGFGPNYHVPKR